MFWKIPKLCFTNCKRAQPLQKIKIFITPWQKRHLGVFVCLRYRILSAALLCSFGWLEAAGSGVGPAYVVSNSDGKVYSVDLQTGVYSEVVTITGSALADIAVLNSSTAYAIDSGNGAIYSIDTQQKQYSLINSIGSNFYSIQLLNNNTAVTTNYNSNGVYTISLPAGTIQQVAIVPGDPGLIGVAIASDSLIYTVGYNDNNVYSVNLHTGETALITPTPLSGGPEPWGIALQNATTAYVAGDVVPNIFKVDLSNGSATLVSPTDIGTNDLLGIALSGNVAYATNTSGKVFAVNLLNGSYFTLADITGSSLYGIGLLLQIPTTGLSGNNLILANYLNANGSFDVINSLAFLGAGLEAGLAAVSPLRNSISTFAAQNSFMASSQVLIDHMYQKRLERRGRKVVKLASAQFDVDECIAGPIQPKKVEQKQGSFTVWGTPFGEYAKVKGKGQLPTFEAGLGGIVAGFDCNMEGRNSVGVAGAYIYTHVHENDRAGKANINQGYLSVYGEVIASQWYFDWGLWGGYYASRNERNIHYPGVNEAAHATIRGWQLAPHFEAGYDGFLSEPDRSKWLGIEPFLLADWVADWEKGFNEKGAGSYNMGQKGRFCSLFRGESGIRFNQVAQMNWGQMFFTEKGSYAYQKAFNTGKITAFLVGSPGNFTVEALQQAQNLGVIEVSLFFSPKGPKTPYFDLRYQGEFGSKYQSHQGMLEIGKSF